jgi:hypothetical protein
LKSTMSKWGSELRRLDSESPATSIVVSITAVVVTVSLVRWFRRKKLKVKILLAEEIRSPRERALEYCYRPRELMLRGYDKVCAQD